jgi:hypothetical protein
MLSHLGFQDSLHRPLHDLAQESGVVRQDLLHQLCVHPTMISSASSEQVVSDELQ